jgi:glutathione synthase/RimK-type ligase-like ATP-grasp enzyme
MSVIVWSRILPESVENCRSKLRQREVLRDAGLPVPEFFSFPLTEPLDTVLPRVSFPSVLKPLRLAASQGVIRANDARVRQVRQRNARP